MYKPVYLFSAILLLWMFSLPVFAQEDAPISPDAPFVKFIEVDSLTLLYPEGMTVIEHTDEHAILGFGDEDTLTVLGYLHFLRRTTRDFDPRDLSAVAEMVYTDFIGAAPPLEAGLEAILLGDVYEGYVFRVQSRASAGEPHYLGYIFNIDGQISAIVLKSWERSATSFEHQQFIVNRMVKGTSSFYSSVSTGYITYDFRATIAALSSIIQLRPLPTDLPSLNQPIASPDGILGFFVPTGWIMQNNSIPEQSMMVVGNSQDALSRYHDSNADFLPEDVVLLVIPRRGFDTSTYDIKISTIDWVALYFDTFDATGIVYQYESELPLYYTQPESPLLPVPIAFIVGQTSNNPYETVMIMLIAGDFDANEATLIAMFQSIQYARSED